MSAITTNFIPETGKNYTVSKNKKGAEEDGSKENRKERSKESKF